ncbi:MAG TPA: glycosyltransferase [Chthoniobacterales bacterium]
MPSSWVGKIGALVLTYNRKDVLSECLRAIMAQVEPVDEVIVLDNGSTDGTSEFLQSSGLLNDFPITLYRVSENLGPSGGVSVLFRLFKERGCDWLWYLDDDTIAGPDALKELKAAYLTNFSRLEEVGFLKSMVVSADGSPNGLPEADLRAAPGYSPSWADRLAGGLVKVRWSTFNSILVPRTTLAEVGTVRPDFYFAGEDIDFTFRVTDVLPGYLVGRSRVTHLCAESGRFSSLLEKRPERISMGAYYYRNNLYFRYNYYSLGRTLLYVGKCLYEAFLALGVRTYPLRRSAAILRGLLSGLVFVARHRKTGEWMSLSGPPNLPQHVGPSPAQVSVVVPSTRKDAVTGNARVGQAEP